MSGPIESRALIIAGVRIRQIEGSVQQAIRNGGLREIRRYRERRKE